MSAKNHSRPLVVINIVGLTPSLMGHATPNLNALVKDGFMAPLSPVFPAVTMTTQSTMLTGKSPGEHGVVGNGWYIREVAEPRFWHQSDHLVQAKKVWHYGRERISDFTCAKIFWQSNMYSEVDYSATLRPIYPADGRKIPALYSHPKALHIELEDTLGSFPYFNYWGPAAGVESSRWIAGCAKHIFDTRRPTLQLVYLPHLDYNLQRLGPDNPAIWDDVRAVDQIAGELISHVREQGADVMVVSEYGIEQVDTCVHINRILREHGFLEVREELGREMLDYGASRGFAVTDHQVAHIYIGDKSDVAPIKQLLEQTPGIERVLDQQGKIECAIDHPRTGDLVAVANSGAWFSYYFWLDDTNAPDYARTVDIHRKPGYDPAELFVDPTIRMPSLKIGWRLLQKKLGMRMLMDVIPLDASLVKGSHGRIHTGAGEGPLVIASRSDLQRDTVAMTGIKDLMLEHWLPNG